MADDELREIRERFDRDRDAWAEIRREGSTDMRYVAGDPWDPQDRKARTNAGRPVLALDELNQYFNQVINDVRANPRSAKFSPVGLGANDRTAEFYSDKMREIEYRSNAQIAYTTAFENAVQRGYGYCRVTTEYESFRSHNQEIVIAPIMNPDMVLIDAEAQRPDSSDMKHCFIYEAWSVPEFRRAFPKAKVQDFDGLEDVGSSWVTDGNHGKIMLAEYWCIETTSDELDLLAWPDGRSLSVLKSEQGSPDFQELIATLGPPQVVRTRKDVEVPQVKQKLTNGVEILEVTDWPGRYIPIVSCFGKVIYVDGGSGAERQILSMTRLARDPYMLYCYYRSTQAEVVGMTPKTPFLGYRGQFRSNPTDWKKAAHEPVAYLEAEPYTEGTEGGPPLPLPQRQPYDPPIDRLEFGAEGARRAIQAAMGSMPLPTQSQRQNEKSGVALRQIEDSTQRGTYHFLDHYDDMIRQVGVIVEDLIPSIYDTARDVGVMSADGEASTIRINDPGVEPSNSQEGPLSTKGDHRVTLSTGPAFESQREAASAFADSLAQNPDIFRLIGPMIVRLKNLGPIGDQIADALKVLQPPELREDEGGGPPVPPEVRQQLQEADQLIQGLLQKVKEQEEQLKTDAAKEQMRTERELILSEVDAKLKLAIQQLKGAQAIELARVKGDESLELQNDAQRHEMATHAADASVRTNENARGSDPGGTERG